MKGAGMIAGRFLRRLGAPLVQLDLPAARAEPLADRRTCEAGADDDGLPLDRRRRSCHRPHVARDEHLALVAESRPLFNREAGCFQRIAHSARYAPRGGRGVLRCEPRNGTHRLVIPHVGVPRRREPVEIDRVGGQAQFAQDADVGEEQCQHDVAELDAVCAGDEQGPARVQRRGLLAHLRMAVVQGAHVGNRERMLLDRHVMQPATARRIALPRLPGRQEVQAETEAGLEDDETFAARPPLRKCVAAEEHMLRLRKAAGAAVVNVVERAGIGRAVA
jgi:hypothetical protein